MLKKKTRLLLFPILVLLLLSLSGCSTWLNLLSTFGYDTNNYAEEEIKAFYSEETDEAVQQTMELARTLVLNSLNLPDFTGAQTAVENYQDAVLMSMLCDNYSRYAGNPALLQEYEEENPNIKCFALIPAAEYEAKIYTIFGGSWKLSNHSSTLFSYSKKHQAYLLITTFAHPQAAPVFVSLAETEHTFRLVFRVSLDELLSDPYEALFFKRDDGTLYFRHLVKQK